MRDYQKTEKPNNRTETEDNPFTKEQADAIRTICHSSPQEQIDCMTTILCFMLEVQHEKKEAEKRFTKIIDILKAD